jgi:hypothetical protein
VNPLHSIAPYISSDISLDFINNVPIIPDKELFLSLLLPTDLNFKEYSIFNENSPNMTMYFIVISSTNINISGIKNILNAYDLDFYKHAEIKILQS